MTTTPTRTTYKPGLTMVREKSGKSWFACDELIVTK